MCHGKCVTVNVVRFIKLMCHGNSFVDSWDVSSICYCDGCPGSTCVGRVELIVSQLPWYDAELFGHISGADPAGYLFDS